MSTLKFCPTCRYYLYLRTEQSPESGNSLLTRFCRNCGHSEVEERGGLITELRLNEKVAEGHKVIVNEFTHLDPTLPHVDNITCRNPECQSIVGGAKPDVIPIKYDAINMKYLYICTVCKEQWRSRS